MMNVAQLDVGRGDISGDDLQSSPPAYPGIAVHYAPQQRLQQQQEELQEQAPPRPPLRQRVRQHNRMPSLEAPNTPVTIGTHDSDGSIVISFVPGNANAEEDRAKHQRILLSNLVSLHNSVQREYHMHNLVQSFYGLVHFAFFYAPAAILMLAGGMISLTTLVYDKDDPTRRFRSFLAGIIILFATIWHGLAHQLRFSSRSIVHRCTAEELRKLSSRLKRRYDDRSGNWSPTLDVASGKNLSKSEMIKFQQLYDQILSSCHSSLPSSFIQTFNYMDVRIETLLGSLHANLDVQWWLMPLVYESLSETIRRAISWPLIFWNTPRWYVERSLDTLLKPTSLAHQLDLDSGEIEDHPMTLDRNSSFCCWKTKHDVSKLEKLVHIRSGRQSSLLDKKKMQIVTGHRGGERRTDSYSSSNEEKMEEGEIDVMKGDYCCHPQAETPTTLVTNPLSRDSSSRDSSYMTNPFGKSPLKWARSLGRSDSSSIESELIYDVSSSNSKPDGSSPSSQESNARSIVSPTCTTISTQEFKAKEREEEGIINSALSLAKEATVEAADMVQSVEQQWTGEYNQSSSFISSSHSDENVTPIDLKNETTSATAIASSTVAGLSPTQNNIYGGDPEIALTTGTAEGVSDPSSLPLVYRCTGDSARGSPPSDASPQTMPDFDTSATTETAMTNYARSSNLPKDDDGDHGDCEDYDDEEEHLSPYKVAVKKAAGVISPTNPESTAEITRFGGLQQLTHSPVSNSSVGEFSVGTCESEDDDSGVGNYPAAAGGGFPVTTPPQSRPSSWKTNLSTRGDRLSPIVSVDGSTSASDSTVR